MRPCSRAEGKMRMGPERSYWSSMQLLGIITPLKGASSVKVMVLIIHDRAATFFCINPGLQVQVQQSPLFSPSKIFILNFPESFPFICPTQIEKKPGL